MTDNPFDLFLRKIAEENIRTIPPIISDLIDQKISDSVFSLNRSEPTLDLDGAIQLLKVSRQTIYQNIKKIPHRKIFGRLVFLRDELLEFIDSNGKTVRNKGDPR